MEESQIRNVVRKALTRGVAAAMDDEIGDLQIAEYIVFLLALDTYMRYVEEATNEDPNDEVTSRGIRMLRISDAMISEGLQETLSKTLPTDAHKKMLARAMAIHAVTPSNVGRRALLLRTLFSRGGPAAQRAVFQTNRALREIREAIAASMVDDADTALDKFAAIPMKNTRLHGWIGLAAKTAIQREIPKNAVDAGSREAVDQATVMMTQQVQSAGAQGSEAVEEHEAAHADVLAQVEQDATTAAAKAIETSGESDRAPSRSETIGIAVAAATAAIADPSKPQNIPDPLRKLDDEQRAAAMTDGRVLVAAGAGAGKCIRGDTLVRTDRGLIPIQSFAEGLDADQSSELHETILGLNGPEVTSVILNNGRRPTLRLTTRCGYQIEGTPNHPLWVLRDGELQWVCLGEIDQSDFICIDRRPGLFAETPYRVTHRPFVKKNSSEPSIIPEELTCQVAELLGFVVSEWQVHYGPHSVVNLTTTSEEQLTLYKRSVQGIISKWTSFYDESEKHWCLKFYRRSNLEALADFGLTYTLAHEKEVPEGILRSPRKVVVSFLRALFDGDGGFHKHTIYYDSSSEKLAQQVHELLLSFGIVSRRRFKPNEKKGCWNISITGDNARLFLREIGFNLVEKQKAAEEAFFELESNPNLDVIPGVSCSFRAVMDSAKERGLRIFHHPKYHTFKCYRNGTRNPSKKLLLEFLEAFPVDTEEYDNLRVFAGHQWFYDAVDEVTPSEADVYDFVVPVTHSFSAGGFVNHNSTTVVSRVEYLVKERRVLPSRIMVTSFNAKAANELKQKIGSAVGGAAFQQMSVGTMHSLFRKFIGEYGTPQERSAMGLGQNRGGFVEGGGSVARAVQRIWAECFPEDTPEEREVPKLKKVLTAKSKWGGNSITPAEARKNAKSQSEIDAADWYEMYEGLKGSIPGWKPPCKNSKGYEAFMGRWRASDQRLGDFDDMLTIFNDILKREPLVRKSLQGMYDHIIVDEAQDLSGVQFSIISQMSEHVSDGANGKSLWICGDDKQCVAADTRITVGRVENASDHGMAPSFTVAASDLKSGDKVMSYRNGQLVPQTVRHVKPSSWTWGYKITTESGKKLVMSPNHKIWATQPEVPDGHVAVYLMYRHDMGFRVGITNKGYSEDYLNSFGGRAFMEKAERMWFLEICEDREQALLNELRYSLKYGVPTAVFGGENRRLNQDRINAVFAEFGKNGGRILEDKYLSFDLPHWMSRSYSKHGRLRRTIQMIAHSSHNTQVAMEWMGDDLDDVLRAASITCDPTSKGTKRIRKYFSNYREALSFAERLQETTKANLQRRLSMDEGPLHLLTASALFPGMSVAVYHGGETLAQEEITSVEKVEGIQFLDLDVADASNFVGGGILSHNSIYGFRGARPDLFTKLNTTDGWKTKMIRTNYRCQPEIVDCANKLIAHNDNQIPMEATASPAKARRAGSVRVINPLDEADAALDVVEEIKSGISAGEDVANNAILTRTNKEQHAFETACIIRGVPYARKGTASFLGSPETKAFLSYVQLATGDDFTKMQTALGEVINKPNRFFVTPDAGAQAVQEALSNYARRNGQDVKTVNPIIALGDPGFQSFLAEKLTRVRTGFKYEKAIEKIETIQMGISEMQANSSDPKFTTKDLFDSVLGMTGLVAVMDPVTGRSQFIEQTFRDSLKADLRDNASEDDDDEDDTEGLGNISFLYQLAQKDPTDEGDLLTDPNTPNGFKAKMERYGKRARELRIDLSKWDKEQAALPPEQRKAPPGVYLGTVHCSPADEPVLTTDGWVPIGDVDPEKHRLASYTPDCNQLFWGHKKGNHEGPDGYGFQKGFRYYKGSLITLTTEGSKTRVTPDHKIRVKFADNFYNKYVVYLMRRGNWWRIGHCKSAPRPYKAGDLSSRISTEKADAGWVLSVCETKEQAIIEETTLQGRYGLPGTTFEASKRRSLSSDQLHEIHESLKDIVGPRAEKLLSELGLEKEYPLYLGGPDRECDKRSSFTIQARNCLSGYMLLPVASKAFVSGTGTRDTWTKPEWHEVNTSREDFEGDVFNLEVFPHHFYVSGGAIVHNSTKGAQWKNCYVSMPKGKFPFEPKPKPGEPPPDPVVAQEEMESERRLGYVALTRAAMNLTVICPSQVGGLPAGVSPFVGQAGLRVGENVPKPGAPAAGPPPLAEGDTRSAGYEGALPEGWE